MRKLCRRAAQFKVAYQFPMAHRTSNMADRLMNHQDRLLYTMQYFHGDKESARLYLRSMALVWNFHPYGARTRSDCSERMSPFTDLNGFRYHDNWLHNLLVARTPIQYSESSPHLGFREFSKAEISLAEYPKK